jgi:hypothetical protein
VILPYRGGVWHDARLGGGHCAAAFTVGHRGRHSQGAGYRRLPHFHGREARKGTELDAARANARAAIAATGLPRRQVRLRPGLRDYADGSNWPIAKGG